MSKAPAADYALEIIEYIARKNTGVGIADISNALGINKNAVSRILESLTEHEWCYMCDTERKSTALHGVRSRYFPRAFRRICL